jgi:DNA polymerase III sliding clamp (beta) subunit (PCNA family)
MFDFQVNLGELLSMQELLKPALGTKGDRLILQTVRMEIQKNKLIMRAFNNVTQIEVSCPVVNSGEVAYFCISSFMFTVLGKYPDKQGVVTFKCVEDTSCIVSQNTRSNEFALITPEKYPDKIVLSNYTSIDLAPVLEAFKLTQVGVADAAKIPAWRCYQLVDDLLLTGDGTQFGRWAGLTEFDVKEPLLLRAKMIMENMKLFFTCLDAGDCEFSNIENWVGFRSVSASVEVAFQKYMGGSVDIERIFKEVRKNEPISTALIDLADLKSILAVCVLYENQALLNAYPAYTTITVENDSVKFDINVEGISTNKEEIAAATTGDSFTIKLLASQLYEVVSLLKCESVLIEFFSTSDPFRVTASEYPTFEYLQSP